MPRIADERPDGYIVGPWTRCPPASVGRCGSSAAGLATGAGPFEIDPQTSRVVGRLALAGDMLLGGDFAFLDGSTWIHDAKSENLIRLEVPAG